MAFILINGLYPAMDEFGRKGDCPLLIVACFIGDYPRKIKSGLSCKRVSHGTNYFAISREVRGV